MPVRRSARERWPQIIEEGEHEYMNAPDGDVINPFVEAEDPSDAN